MTTSMDINEAREIFKKIFPVWCMFVKLYVVQLTVCDVVQCKKNIMDVRVIVTYPFIR